MSSNTEPPAPRRVAVVGEPKLDFESLDENGLHRFVNEQTASDIWILILLLRCANAVLVWTFFQPDEYFQSLEPAWQMAFGPDSGAWITWEWQHQLRSSLHPALFAAVYYVADKPMELLGFFPQFRAMILSVLPNLVQAFFAALGDYYTWKLSEKMYGIGSNNAWVTLLMTLFSPWQWFCSTRTFSNSLETTLTITALYFWPWDVTLDSVRVDSKPESGNAQAGPAKSAKSTTPSTIFQTAKSIKHLRISLLLALTACILRPTNLLIWFCILMPTLTRMLSSSSPTSRVAFSDYLILIREFTLCSAIVLTTSAISDRLYFGTWTFPPYQFLHFNISQDLAIFYGRNDFHYYLSQGLPLLLTTYLPFTLLALYHSSSSTGIQFLFTVTIATTIGTLSLISHKEVRFIYPLLPVIHLLTAPIFSSFFYTTSTKITHPPPFPSTPKVEAIITIRRKLLLAALLVANLLIAFYTTIYHQSGAISAISFLRHEYEELALDDRGVELSHPDANKYADGGIIKKTDFDPTETFVGFLMPCHSTPWRSQLIYPGLKAWALGCEPPLHLKAGTEERTNYRDEADRFYDNPKKFFETEINTRERPWPRYIVGFEGIGHSLEEYYEGSAGMPGFRVVERWRGFNSHWHDDWRRKGDIVIWEFVDGTRIKEREARRALKGKKKNTDEDEEWLRSWSLE